MGWRTLRKVSGQELVVAPSDQDWPRYHIIVGYTSEGKPRLTIHMAEGPAVKRELVGPYESPSGLVPYIATMLMESLSSQRGAESEAFGEGSVQQLFPFLDPEGEGPVFDSEPPHDPLSLFDSMRQAAEQLAPGPERERTIEHIERVRRQSAINLGIELDDED